MPSFVRVSVDYKQVSAGLDDLGRVQLDKAVARSVTNLAFDVQDALKNEMLKVFDKPTLYTMRGVVVKKADRKTQDVLEAQAYFQGSEQAGGRNPYEYLQPQANERTYARLQKKCEYLLTINGYLPQGWITVPGRYIVNSGKLDPFGNMPGSYYKQIIRELMIKNTKGPPKPRFAAAVKRTVKMGVDSEFIAVKPGANQLGKNGGYLPSGVYKRTGVGGRKLQQYLKFVARASYHQRLDVRGVAERTIKLKFQPRWDESFALAFGKYMVR